MSNFAQSVGQIEEGARLLDESINLHRSAAESEELPEMLELTLRALDRDLEALSLLWEALVSERRELEKLRDDLKAKSGKIEARILDF